MDCWQDQVNIRLTSASLNWNGTWLESRLRFDRKNKMFRLRQRQNQAGYYRPKPCWSRGCKTSENMPATCKIDKNREVHFLWILKTEYFAVFQVKCCKTFNHVININPTCQYYIFSMQSWLQLFIWSNIQWNHSSPCKSAGKCAAWKAQVVQCSLLQLLQWKSHCWSQLNIFNKHFIESV